MNGWLGAISPATSLKPDRTEARAAGPVLWGFICGRHFLLHEVGCARRRRAVGLPPPWVRSRSHAKHSRPSNNADVGVVALGQSRAVAGFGDRRDLSGMICLAVLMSCRAF